MQNTNPHFGGPGHHQTSLEPESAGDRRRRHAFDH
jgi:hypothetical protein